MKRDAGWATIFLAAVATTFGFTSLQSKSGTEPAPVARRTLPAAPKTTVATNNFNKDTCGELERHLQQFLDLPEKDTLAPDLCYKKNHQPPPTPGSKAFLQNAKHLRFVIATLPDPLHTHLSLTFDRFTEAIQQAAQDADFTYDSSWLPWETEQGDYPLVGDQDIVDQRTERREDQPGILLFRKNDPDPNLTDKDWPNNSSYSQGLIVFVVGDEATSGIHRYQFKNAVEWISALQPSGPVDPQKGIKILAPSFSGSLQSLAQTLQEKDVHDALGIASKNIEPQKAPKKQLDIYSTVTSHSAVQGFVQYATQPLLADLDIDFHSFREDDDTAMEHYCSYLVNAGLDVNKLAIISEDETEYGASPLRKPDKGGSRAGSLCTPKSTVDSWRFPGAISFYYPRDISALRNAYQEQSLFNRNGAQPSTDVTHRTLRTNLADPEGKQDDTIRSYGGSQTALSEESVLLHIVDMLRAHQSQFILLKSTNPLDQVFLAHFFTLTFPEGRIYTLGDDLLFRRELGSSGLTGVMNISTYPLLPESDDWTKPSEPPTPPDPEHPNYPQKPRESGLSHAHHVFTHTSMEATYIALRVLLDPTQSAAIRRKSDINKLAAKEGIDSKLAADLEKNEASKLDPIAKQAAALKLKKDAEDLEAEAQRDPAGFFFGFLPPNCSFSFSGFNLPDYSAPYWLPAYHDQHCHQPVTWISVLGSDRLWPVASLDEVYTPAKPTLSDILPWFYPHAPGVLAASLKSIFLQIFAKPPSYVEHYRLPDVPLSMNLAIAAIFLWSIFHMWCCWHPSITVKPDHRSYFVRMRSSVSLYNFRQEPIRPRPVHPRSHMALIVFGSILLVMVCTVTAWGYGWMSPEGEPIHHPRLYSLFPIAVWGIALFAIARNAWVEYQLAHRKEIRMHIRILLNHPIRWFKWRREVLRAIFPSLLSYAALTFAIYLFFLLYLDDSLYAGVRVPTYFRSMNLTSGVSPVLPLVLLALGMYGWVWYSLRGLALFNGDRPLLPNKEDLLIDTDTGPQQTFTMMSRERAGDPMEALCWPTHRKTVRAALLVFLSLFIATAALCRSVPLRCLGTQRYSWIICIWIAISISILLANSWQLMRLWLRLRVLLVFLDKLPLRRTLQVMRGFTWGSIWKMGGNVLELRYKLFYRQFESLDHLQSAFEHFPPDSALAKNPQCDPTAWAKIFADTYPLRLEFFKWHSQHWDKWKARDLTPLQGIQQQVAQLAGRILAGILLPTWNAEQESLLITTPPSYETSDAESLHAQHLVLGLEPYVKSAEELVCLVYLGFIQNILGRMRSLIMAMIWLFLSIALVLPSYPFDPRPILTGSAVALFVIVSAVVFVVYSQMFRDATLSHLTNTRPGELGMEFWLKFISFGVGPLFGLLATVFPEFSSFFFSWLQPSLSSIK